MDTFGPREAHELLGFPMSTLRRYAVVYSDYLSDHANQTPRRYNGQDLNLLAYIYQSSAEGMQIAEIKDNLSNMVFEDDFIVPDDYTPPVDKRKTTKADEQNALMLSMFQAALDAKNEQIDYLKSEIERLRRPWYKKLFGGE